MNNKKIYISIILGFILTYSAKAQLVSELGLGTSFSNPKITNRVNTEKHIFQQYAADRTPKFSVGYKFNKFYPYFNILIMSSSLSVDMSDDIDNEKGHNIKINYTNWYKGVGLMYQFYQQKKISMNVGIEFGTFRSHNGIGYEISTNSVAFLTTIPVFQNRKRQYTYGLKYQLEYTPKKNSIGLDIFYNRAFNTIYNFSSDFQIHNHTGSFDTQSKAGQLYIGINYKIYWIKKKPKE